MLVASSSTLKASWEKPNGFENEDIEYNVKWRSINITNEVTDFETVITTDYTIDNLPSCVAFEVEVFAFNQEFGNGVPTKKEKTIKPEGEIPKLTISIIS